jgi:Ni,Fe-hydrogenase maturation factor
LLDVIADYKRAILVDAIQTRDGKPGDIHRPHPNDLQASLHSGTCPIQWLTPAQQPP